MKGFGSYIFVLFVISFEDVLSINSLQRVGKRLYKQDLLSGHFNYPTGLTYDADTRKLYFSYLDSEIEDTRRAYINIVTRQTVVISGIQGNKATAVDSRTGDVYFGNARGLYRLTPERNEAYNIGLFDTNILKMLIRNNEMFVHDGNNHMLYKIFFDSGRAAATAICDKEAVIDFTVDNKRNVHYVTMHGMFCLFGGTLMVKNVQLQTVNHFLVVDDTTYGLTGESIYEIDCETGTATKISDISFYPTSITSADYGDLFYSLEHEIYRLKPLNSYRWP